MIPDFEGMLEAVYSAALRPGDVAVDVGAHIGRHALPMARAVGPGGRVYAFEPLPIAYAQLKEAVEAASNDSPGLAKVVSYNLALGAEEGPAEFVYVPEFPEYSGFKERLYHSDALRKERIQVQVRRLDSFREELGKIRFIKVDAEGGELTILRGALSTISESLPLLSFELGNASLSSYPYVAADYYDFCSGLGYKLFSIFGIPLTRDEFIAAADEQLFWDYIAVPGGGGWPFGHAATRVLLKQLGGIGSGAASERGGRAEEASLGDLLSRTEAAEAKVAELLASRSWRLTNPLRQLYKLMKSK